MSSSQRRPCPGQCGRPMKCRKLGSGPTKWLGVGKGGWGTSPQPAHEELRTALSGFVSVRLCGSNAIAPSGRRPAQHAEPLRRAPQPHALAQPLGSAAGGRCCARRPHCRQRLPVRQPPPPVRRLGQHQQQCRRHVAGLLRGAVPCPDLQGGESVFWSIVAAWGHFALVDAKTQCARQRQQLWTCSAKKLTCPWLGL